MWKKLFCNVLILHYFLSGFLKSMILSFKDIVNKHDVYNGKDCMKHFCESLREHAIKITNF